MPICHHRFGHIIGVSPEPHAGSSAKQNYLHMLTYLASLINGHFRNRHDEATTPLPDELQLLHDFVFQIPGQDHDIVRLGLGGSDQGDKSGCDCRAGTALACVGSDRRCIQSSLSRSRNNATASRSCRALRTPPLTCLRRPL